MNRFATRSLPILLPLTLAGLVACETTPSPLGPDRLPLHAVAPQPVQIDFEKHLDAASSQFDADGNPVVLVWRGTVNGDPSTTLTSTIDMRTPGTRSAGKTLHATVRWEIVADARSFVAVTQGVVNLETGLVRTNGVVDSGWMAGGRVHQEGQLDAALSARGFLRVLPGSAR